MKKNYDAIKVYFKKNLLIMGLLGFSSGLPLLLTLTTLTWWLTSVGIDKKTIGLFTFVGLPYSYKYIWSPFVDRLPFPFLSRLLGRRRGWLIGIQAILTASIIAMGNVNPLENIELLAIMSIVVAFWSATQDIIIDAYRIQLLSKDELAAGGAMEVNGYRLGMMVAGAGAMAMSDYMSWSNVYMIVALFMSVGILTAFFAPATKHDTLPQAKSLKEWVKTAIVGPFRDITSKPAWGLALLLVASYKLGDVLIGPMAMVFYHDIGFSGQEVGTVTKLFGIPMTIVGTFLIGGFAYKWGLLKTLLITGFVHLSSNFMFVVLSEVGHSVPMLYIAIALENISNGMSLAVFIAFLSHYCSPAFAATQYALLSSLTAQTRTLGGALSGYLAELFPGDWPSFFILTMIAGVPSLILIVYLMKTNKLKLDR